MRRAAFRIAVLFLLACEDPGAESALPRVATISLHPATATIQIGRRLTLTPILLDADGTELTDRSITWSSSRPAVASVAAGVVTAVGPGETLVSAVAEGRSAEARISVQFGVDRVVIAPESPVIATGTSIQLTATARGPGGTELDDRIARWLSLSPRIATVSVGKVRGLRVGTAQIVATVDNHSTSTTVTVLPNVSGRWTLTASVEDTARGITCAGSGLLTVVQSGGAFDGVHERLQTCTTPGGTLVGSETQVIRDAGLSAGRLDFLLTGGLRCYYVGELTGTPPTMAAGEVSCTGGVGGGPAALQGRWEMRR
jgi:hypothetical protein